ncbi:hypothetical protein [Paenibacillus polymyxa]|uniref:hypothetical protein n=1 Tax=Paenibacillus polymyxa TaxID=1406 RepID=UPI00234ACFEA|nr:hypothetical protein [Paenibacillus polymyxa]WCM61385.1 hypothetical protein OYT09_26225 [Paenibacillus polymyxa]
MAKHTIIELNESLKLETIEAALKKNAKSDLTPEKGKWPRQEKIYAEFIPFNGEFRISEVETKIVMPAGYHVKLKEEEITELEFMPGISEQAATVAEKVDRIEGFFKEKNIVESVRMLYSYVRIQRARDDWFDKSEELLPLDKRINVYESDVVFFEIKNCCYAVIKGSSKSAHVARVKKDLLASMGFLNMPKGIKAEEVGIPVEYRLSSDFFYWLYYVYKERKGIINCNPYPIFLLAVSGFTGTAIADTQRTKSNGDRIAQLLTTHAFIFGKDDMKAFRLTLQYGKEIIQIELNNDGSIDLIHHSGEYARGNLQRERAELILVYKVFIPLITQAYQDDKGSKKVWGPDILETFLHKIGKEMIDSIQASIDKQVENLVHGNSSLGS